MNYIRVKELITKKLIILYFSKTMGNLGGGVSKIGKFMNKKKKLITNQIIWNSKQTTNKKQAVTRATNAKTDKQQESKHVAIPTVKTWYGIRVSFT